MKLSDHFFKVGRAVAYYPKLRKVTGSTTANLLLCQLMYWYGKTPSSPWIKRTNYELEEETGLTYNEQKTARKTLVELGILREVFVRSERTNAYKVNIDVLNELWDKAVSPEKEQDLIPDLIPEDPAILKPSPESDKLRKMQSLRKTIEEKLQIIASGQQWESFIEFAYWREEKQDQKLETYLDWALSNGFDPVYWTPSKMRTTYPRAFTSGSATGDIKKDFVAPLPEYEEKICADMPDDLKVKKKLY